MQEDRQELPYEQRQDMQLRQKLRLLGERTKAQPGIFAHTQFSAA
jgi:hypothetical protein